MKNINVSLFSLAMASALCGAELQFKDISDLTSNTESFTSAAFGTNGSGNPSFLAVTANGNAIYSEFIPQESWLTNALWRTVVGGGVPLSTVTFSSGSFVAGGIANQLFQFPSVFANPNGVSIGTVFPNNADMGGLADNGRALIAVGRAPELSYATNIADLASITWNAANLQNPSFAESFRGVARMGTNGFVSCGVYGFIRTSTDLKNWSKLRGQIGLPDLLGVASDGRTIVAVGFTGGNGVIVATNNGGSSAIANLVITNTPLNGVTYTPTIGYIAVGNGGRVFTSTNGVDWPASGSYTNTAGANFASVAFSDNVLMRGVGVIVGAGGNVTLVGATPPVPEVVSNATVCAGSPNPPLIVRSEPDIFTVDWFACTNCLPLTTGTNIVGTEFSFTPDIEPLNISTTRVYFARTRDLRTGFVSDFQGVTNTIHERPTATFVDQKTICNGETTSLQAQLTGTAPWVVKWASNDITVLTFTSLVSTVTFTNTPNNTNFDRAITNTYKIVELSDSNSCSAELGDLVNSASITVNPRAMATIVTTNISLCNGDTTAIIEIDLRGGIPPWQIVWTNGFGQYTQEIAIAGVSLPFRTNLQLNATSVFQNATNVFAETLTNYNFWIAALTDVNGCVANAPGDVLGTNISEVKPRPSATLLPGNNIICNGETNARVEFQLRSGISPFTVIWTNGFLSFTQQITVAPGGLPFTTNLLLDASSVFQNVTNRLVGAATNYFFSVARLTDANNCLGNLPGDLVGTNVTTVNPRASVAILTSTNNFCNGDTSQTIGIEIRSGIPPWRITWANGFVQYTQIVNAAPGVPLPLQTNLALDASSILQNATNVFLGVFTNYQYAIVAISDLNQCANLAGDIVGTNTTRVNPRPTAAIVGPNNTICNGATNATVSFEIRSGFSPWTVVWTNGFLSYTQVVTLAVPTLPFVTNLPLDATTVFRNATNVLTDRTTNYFYSIARLTDASACGTNLPGDLIGTNITTVSPRPSVAITTLTNNLCNGDFGNIVFELRRGIAPWTIVWSNHNLGLLLTQEVTTVGAPLPIQTNLALNGADVFRTVSNSLVTGTTSFVFSVVSLSDASSCMTNWPLDIVGTNVTRVDPIPSASLTTPDSAISVKITGGANSHKDIDIPLTIGLTGTPPFSVTLRLGSTNRVINNLSTGLFTTNWTVRIFKATPSTNFLFRITSLTGGACTKNDTNLLPSVEVAVDQKPNAEVSGTNTICSGESAPIDVELGGKGPWRVTWSDGLVTTNANSYTRMVPLTNSTLLSTTYLFSITALRDFGFNPNKDAEPEDITNGVARITVLPIPSAAPVPATNLAVTCDGIVPLLSVSVPPGFTASWFDGTGTNLLASNTTNFYPPLPPSPTNGLMTNFVVKARFGSLDATCLSTGSVSIAVIVQPCTNELKIARSDTNALVSWYGNFVLQSATNIPDTTWLSLTQGIGGITNIWTNKLAEPPTNHFFRLYAPTNH